MPSKSRGGLSKREYAGLKGTTGSTKVSNTEQAKKSASSSVSKESKSLAKAQSEYIKSLTPSAEENAALKANQDLLLNQEQATQKITNTQGAQGNTIPLSLIGGQVERLNRDTETKTIPLKYQIAALQSAREAKSTVAHAKYTGASQEYNRKVSASKAKTVDPLDTEYKTLRNERAKVSLAKAKKGSSGSGKDNSLKLYNAQKAENTARGLVTLPKGVAGPPVPKVLIPKKSSKSGRTAN